MTSLPSRRAVLRGAGAAAAVPLLGACGHGPASRPVGQAATGIPRRGGRLRAALPGAGPAESLNPFEGASPVDYARNRVIYDPFFVLIGGRPRAGLALQAVPVFGGKAFRITLRPKVTWQDGSPFTADDAAYTLRYVTDPARRYPSELSGYLDAAAVKILDAHTIEVPVRRPIGDLAALLAESQTFVIKNGARSFGVGGAIGTGPFRVRSFDAGRSSTLTRYDGYWGGRPYLDELVFLSLDDPQARVNAVRSGEADYATPIPYTEARAAGNGDVVVRTAGADARTGFGLVLNTVKPPFDDPRARRAVRLAIDRRQLVDSVFLGYGIEGNDLFGAGTEYYASDLRPLAHDPVQARRLLQAAGAGGARIVVRTTELESGLNESVEIIAAQLKAVGLTVTPQVVTSAQFRDLAAMSGANAITLALGAYPLQTIYSRIALVPALALRDTRLARAQGAAMVAPGEAARAAAWRTVQQVMYDHGNVVVWGFGDTLSLALRKVTGVQARGQAKYPYLGMAGLV